MSGRVLVLGAGGMLGHQVLRELSGKFDVVGTVRGRAERLNPFAHGAHLETGIDLTDQTAVERIFAKVNPIAVVNCAGLIKQRSEAADPIALFRANSLLPVSIAALCDGLGIRLIHFSTDCVFSGREDGARGPDGYRETDVPDPPDWYGRTKLMGEVGGRHLTLRTSLIGREVDGQSGLVEWFLSNRGGAVQGYTRALFTGLTTPAAARLVADLLVQHPNLGGVFQVASPPISKYDLLQLMNEKGSLGTKITPDDKVFCDRRLDGSRFARMTGWRPAGWPEMIDELLAESPALRSAPQVHARAVG